MKLVENQLGIFGLAIGREPHHFVFARVDLETGVVGECRIKQPKRMGEVQFLSHLQMIAAPEADRRGRPLANSVHGEDHRLVEQRRKERGCRVALVVFREQELAFPIKVGIECAQLVAQQLLLEQLLFQPERDRHAKGAKALGRKRQIGFEQPLKLEERLVVKCDVVDLAKRDAALAQAIGEGMMWETENRVFCA